MLLPHTCHECLKQYPLFPRCRLNTLEVCLSQRVGVREGVIVTLPFTPADASEEYRVANMP